MIALFSFRLTYPSKACILTAKDLCKRWGILSSYVSEIHHLLAATLSFATLPLGNNPHAILWIIQYLPYWLRAASVLHVKGRKTGFRFKIMSTVIEQHFFMSIKSKLLRNTFHHSLCLLFTDPKTFYLMPMHAIFAQLLISSNLVINFLVVIPKKRSNLILN